MENGGEQHIILKQNIWTSVGCSRCNVEGEAVQCTLAESRRLGRKSGPFASRHCVHTHAWLVLKHT
jgi:hypothetical protein